MLVRTLVHMNKYVTLLRESQNTQAIVIVVSRSLMYLAIRFAGILQFFIYLVSGVIGRPNVSLICGRFGFIKKISAGVVSISRIGENVFAVM